MAKKGVGGTRGTLEQSRTWFQSRFAEIMLALGLRLCVGGGEAGSRAESSKRGQDVELQNQDYRQAPKKEGEKRREASGSRGSLLLGDRGRETIREAVLQRSQNKQAGTDVGIQLRGRNGLSSTTQGSLPAACPLP